MTVIDESKVEKVSARTLGIRRGDRFARAGMAAELEVIVEKVLNDREVTVRPTVGGDTFDTWIDLLLDRRYFHRVARGEFVTPSVRPAPGCGAEVWEVACTLRVSPIALIRWHDVVGDILESPDVYGVRVDDAPDGALSQRLPARRAEA